MPDTPKSEYRKFEKHSSEEISLGSSEALVNTGSNIMSNWTFTLSLELCWVLYNATDEKNICKDYINWEPGKMA